MIGALLFFEKISCNQYAGVILLIKGSIKTYTILSLFRFVVSFPDPDRSGEPYLLSMFVSFR